jgi:phosphoribosylglycinamide formyltransferase 1
LHNILTLVIPHIGLTRDEHEEKIIKQIKKNNIEYDLIILAGYMRILSKEFIENLGKPILNIHPSLLPAFPGLNVQKKALDSGVKYTGCTVHLVSEDVDAGRILGQKVVPILDNDTEESLSQRILEQEHILYSEVIGDIIDNKIQI